MTTVAKGVPLIERVVFAGATPCTMRSKAGSSLKALPSVTLISTRS